MPLDKLAGISRVVSQSLTHRFEISLDEVGLDIGRYVFHQLVIAAVDKIKIGVILEFPEQLGNQDHDEVVDQLVRTDARIEMFAKDVVDAVLGQFVVASLEDKIMDMAVLVVHQLMHEFRLVVVAWQMVDESFREIIFSKDDVDAKVLILGFFDAVGDVAVENDQIAFTQSDRAFIYIY